MEQKFIKVNDQYLNIYSTFSSSEVNSFYDEVLFNNFDNVSIDELSYTDYEVILTQVKEVIEDGVSKDITSQYLVVDDILFYYRTKLRYNSPLFLLAKVPIVPDYIDIITPNKAVEIKPFVVTDEVITELINELFISQGLYDYEFHETCLIDNDRVIIKLIEKNKVDYQQIDKDDLTSLVDFYELIGYNIDDDISHLLPKGKYTNAYIDQVLTLKPLELTDEVVKSIKILGFETKEELVDAYKEYISTLETINFQVDEMLASVVELTNLEITNEVYYHRLKIIEKNFGISLQDKLFTEDELKDLIKNTMIRSFLVQIAVMYDAPESGFLDEQLIRKQFLLRQALLNELDNEEDFYEYFLEQFEIRFLYRYFVYQGKFKVK